MRFTPLVLLAAGAIAWTVPKGQPDGVYEVHTEPDGTEIHTFLRGLYDSVESRTPVPEKFNLPKLSNKRQIPGVANAVGCGGYSLLSGNTDAANNALDAQCGDGAFGNYSIFLLFFNLHYVTTGR